MLLLPVALAHVPHAQMSALVVPRADPTLPWFATAVCETPTTVFRSDDLGETWDPVVAAPAVEDNLVDGAYTTGGLVLLGSQERYFVSADGETWTEAATPGRLPSMVSAYAGGERLLMAGTGGIWAIAADGSVTLDLEISALNVHEGQDGPLAVSDLGEVYLDPGGGWTSLGRATRETIWSATSGDGAAWVGTATGRIYTWDGADWSECGATGLTDYDVPHAQISRLDYLDGRLWATASDVGPAYSDDGCATWTSVVAPIHNDFTEDATGSYTSDEMAYVGLVAVEDRVILGGFDGLALTTDGGASWRVPPLVGAGFAEGIAFSRSFDDDGLLWIAGYGAGLVRVSDFGTSFEAVNAYTAQPNAQDVLAATSATTLSPALAVVNMEPFRSDDDGASWQGVEGPFTLVRLLDRGPGERFYALNVSGDTAPPGGFYRSEDGGRTWADLPGWPTELAREPVANMADDGGWLCGQTRAHVACSSDDGASWSTIFPASGAPQVQNIELWPPGAPSALLISSDDGVWRWDGAALTQIRDGSTPRFQYFAAADDGRLFAVDLLGTIWESPDGGLAWVETGAQIAGQVRVLAARAGFAEHPDLLVGGVDGTFRVRDGVVERFANYQRVDDGTRYVRCQGCTGVEDTTATMRQYTSYPATSTGEVYLRGHTVRVRGRSPHGAVARIEVDGVEGAPTKVAASTDLEGVALEVSGLADGWHRVVFSVDVGELHIDGVDALGEGVSLAPEVEHTGEPTDTDETADTDPGETADTEPTDTEDSEESAVDSEPADTEETAGETGKDPVDEGCACGASPRVPWLGLLAALVLRARRSRAG